jgi:hypothetical protein
VSQVSAISHHDNIVDTGRTSASSDDLSYSFGVIGAKLTHDCDLSLYLYHFGFEEL